MSDSPRSRKDNDRYRSSDYDRRDRDRDSRYSSRNGNSSESQPSFRSSRDQRRDNYRRAPTTDTPSHPGGLSRQAVLRNEHRKSMFRRGENSFSSSSKGEDRYREYDEDRNSSSSSNRSSAHSSRHSSPRSVSRVTDDEWARTPQRPSTPSGSTKTLIGGLSTRQQYTDRLANQNVSSQWDIITPIAPSGYHDSYDPNSIHFDKEGFEEWQQQQQQLDRDWYGMEESGAIDNDHNDFAEYSHYYQELENKLQQKTKRQTIKQLQHNEKNDLWEMNQMGKTGAAQRKERDTDFDESGPSVHVLVQDIKPPFLSGKQVFTKQMEAIQSVRDPTSDLAIFAKKGSRLVRESRERKEKMKATRDALNMAQTTLGKMMGIKDQTELTGAEKQEKELKELEQEEKNKDDEEDPRKNSKFSSHMKEESSGSSQFSKSLSLKEQAQYLPAFACRDELLKVIRDNQIVVVIGETGSGKTTQLTQYLHRDGYSKSGMIACTQPRRVAAMSVAKRVSEEMECKLGEEVGYAIRFEDCSSEKTIIKYMTDGILLRESLRSSDLDNYSAIIMDEAHERSLHTDVLMGLIKKIIARRNDLKLIVTSATMNADKFSKFFGNVPIFTIPGRTFPVDIMFSKTPCEDYVDSAVKQALSIHLSSPPGDILIFMTGQEDIEITCDVIKDRLEQLDDVNPLAVLPIYSQMPADLQAKIFQKAPDQARKCIVATNIAETSLTVDGIMYVIDTGYNKLKVYNPRIGMDALQITPVSQANANQRSGRAGRTGAGTCFRLYTEQAFNYEMFINTIPEIQRANLSNVVLLLKSLGVENLLDFDFIDPPAQDTILNSMYQLWIYGALDNNGALTPLGKKMNEFPLDPALSKLLVISEEMGCTAEILTIVSMLSVPSVFYRPKERLEESDAAREKFQVQESDHLTLLNVFEQWKKNGYRDSWCNAHFIQPKAMLKAREVRSQLMDIMKSQNMAYVTCGSTTDIVRKCICSAYFHQAAKVKGIGEYVNLRSGMPCQLHPTSALYGMGFTPDYIVYNELVMTSKEYMQCVTAIEPEWLSEYGGIFFSIKKSGHGHKENRELQSQQLKNMNDDFEKNNENLKRIREIESIPQSPRSAIATPGRRSDASTPRPKRRGFGI
ncbi:P-loop containing nucleoside triphosphate hydrolase protein [Conidiobolus coronatus NRRL 28638]|uniref:Pre-mRNA-splicing factor ATP-dependent RNA helicase PRP16 n=1 Tax=Conidiobolus coronatus (strain ATCC 28846 / CBS 209.66 / NRRL 28638) TaxID=796925 RepID=A0A137P7A9_CONC2|nr:P-loop containing nucleoside triphosphate hydrolase protein [Conidiobolus coronatus NRRL 28638]|eukprot:KXN70896.1 P-loop containing nucleoside triphosphate hydrolase protein [Conidiobolus coronatus NRRL 28638]